MSAFTTSTQHSIGSHSHSDQTRRRNKKHPNWKGGSKTVIVCIRHDRVHRKPYSLQKKFFFYLVSEVGKIARYKVNIQKSKAFCTPRMKYQTKKSGKKNPFDIATRKIKYLGIDLTMEVKDYIILNTENYRILEKNIKEDTNK